MRSRSPCTRGRASPIVVTCCVLSAISTAAAATTWQVPGDVSTIAAALDSAASADTVLVSCGTWFEHDLTVPSGVTLRGVAAGDPTCVIIDAKGLGRVIDVAQGTGVRIEGLTLQNGLVPDGGGFGSAGGAIRCDSAEVSVADCVLTGNVAPLGAGLAGRASTLTVLRTSFQADSASASQWAAGGGLYAQGCTGSFTECAIDRCGAYSSTLPGDGGAAFLQANDFLFTDCAFTRSSAGIAAGAVYLFLHDTSRFVGCTFSGNAASSGGAAFVEAAEPSFEGCTFYRNTAANGGSMFTDAYDHVGSQVEITDCLFENETAKLYAGGALDIRVADFTITGSTFRSCTAGTRGGAVSVRDTVSAEIADCLFEDNEAWSGAALWGGDYAAGALTRCTVRGSRTTSVGGGAIDVTAYATVQVDSSIIAFSTDGAAGNCSGFSSLLLLCSDVYGNADGDWIGCLASQLGAWGNFSEDPLFCPSGNDASVLFPDSPCLPENSPCGGQVGVAGAGCGCPAGATILVPDQAPTVAAALASAGPGDVVGVCVGEWTGGVTIPSGVHLLGAGRGLTRLVADSTSPGPAVLRAANVTDSTVVQDLTLDGRGLVPQVVLVESYSTGLHLVRNAITGGQLWGVVNLAGSRVQIGDGRLGTGNDLFGSGGASPGTVRNDSPDSLEATFNWWGTMDHAEILASIEGPVRLCPITDPSHQIETCPAVDAPAGTTAMPRLAVAPNPFRSRARITWTGTPGVASRVAVHDVTGRRVRTLSAFAAPGFPRVATWDGRDDHDEPVASGIYFVRLEWGDAATVRKVVLLR